jgi:ABC-type branched-subunit amino acid transport system substrate-binding protein
MYKVLIVIATIIISILPFVDLESNYNEKEIRLGMSGPFSGNLKFLGEEFLLGANLYFKYINEKGGIYGRSLRVINKDDKYEPRIATENVEDLINKDRVFALFGVIGTPISKEVLPIAIEHRIPYIAPFSGVDFLRTNPRNPIILNARTSYDKEIKKLIEYFVEVKKRQRIAVFYQNDTYGRSGLRSVKKFLSEKGLNVVAEGSYKRNTLSVGHALYEIKAKNPEVVILISATKPGAEFIKRARNEASTKHFEFGTISFLGSQMLVKALNYKGDGIVFSQVVPSPWDATTNEVILYRTLMQRYNPKKEYSFVSLEGYFAARMTAELFQRVGRNFTKEDYIGQMRVLFQEMQNSNLAEEGRICKCLNKVYLTEYDDKKFRTIYEKD